METGLSTVLSGRDLFFMATGDVVPGQFPMSLRDWLPQTQNAGKTATEDLLGSIFSQFCIGK